MVEGDGGLAMETRIREYKIYVLRAPWPPLPPHITQIMNLIFRFSALCSLNCVAVDIVIVLCQWNATLWKPSPSNININTLERMAGLKSWK